MAVDLEDLVPSLRRMVNPPGSELFPDATDGILTGYLSDAFWVGKLNSDQNASDDQSMSDIWSQEYPDVPRSVIDELDWDLLEERDKDGIVASYLSGWKVKEIAANLGITPLTVSRRMKKLGFKWRRVGLLAKAIPDEQVDEVVRRYLDGEGCGDLGRDLNVSPMSVNTMLRRCGVKIRSNTEQFVLRSGGTKVSSGYRWIYVRNSGSPFEEMMNASGYIAEHRLVVAEDLGRCLRPDETVHHIDGDRLNNDVSNLQLRQGHHGSGVVMRCRSCGSNDVEHEELL